MVRVGVNGAAGRMGRSLIDAIADNPSTRLSAAIERPDSSLIGADAGELAGLGPNGVPVVASLGGVIDAFDVLIDFSLTAVITASWWLLSWRVLRQPRPHWIWSLLVGVSLGLVTLTRATGLLLLWLPLLLLALRLLAELRHGRWRALAETLLAARREPERYRDLLVRVAGYSAYFVDLLPQLQDEIIARTEHCF